MNQAESQGTSADPSALELLAARGAGWSVGMGVVIRGVGLAGSLLLTHYLTPEQAGQVITASVAVFTANMFSLSSTSGYMVVHPKATRSEGFHVTVLHMLLGTVTIGGAVLLAPALSGFLNVPHLQTLAFWTAIAVYCDRLRCIPDALLQRDMRFRTLVLVKAAADFAYTGTSVGLAMYGFGGYSILIANLVRYPLGLVLSASLAPRADWLTPGRLSLGTAKRIYAWSTPVSIAWIGEYASRQWDNLLVAHFYGGSIVGSYEKAHSLAEVPAAQVSEPVMETLLPVFSRLEGQARRAALLRSIGIVGLLVFPLLMGLSTVASTVVSTLMGAAWVDVGPMVAIMSAVTIGRPFSAVVGAYLQATDGQRAMAVLGVFKVCLLFAAAWTIGRVSPLWACTIIGIEFGGHSLASLAFIARRDGVSGRAIVRRVVPPLVACVPMVVAILAVRWALAHAGIHTKGVGLAAELAVGAITFIPSALLIAGPISREFLALVAAAMRRRPISLPRPVVFGGGLTPPADRRV